MQVEALGYHSVQREKNPLQDPRPYGGKVHHENAEVDLANLCWHWKGRITNTISDQRKSSFVVHIVSNNAQYILKLPTIHDQITCTINVQKNIYGTIKPILETVLGK